MANNMQLSTAARTAMCDALVDLIDAGSGAGTLKIYTATQPAGPGTAITDQTILATLTFSDPAFGAAASGVATADTITSDTSVDNSGTAAWGRIADSDSTAIIDVSIGTSGADINFDSVTFVAGGTAAISSLTVTVPAGP